ncbi:2,3-bisphosphoglycerate-dependent phosphoglycerate mutase [Candidatus Liberibacter africanus]|uniref:2,3-bisphosphoglycerate-dependent phosphoglycerate mutase n=1 Tax=Candidatus Liberibacter africanus PTSAPSY TaxID=1277257 RepID=A0A0G3I7Z9_LIBAF|nr:2,3-bisphosphoglycerate-dependent phosphoglycerate mutase [Candidatus Liberibacter africanus]AKK19847.1 phosphoglyceromutase [Candidatus Liberibacter africanus PTSAPSY]QTP63707.1 2,3-bisphosphoglycerate-dependent phosphoglycerate mutase [Candidatus Liberibacter africanus]
MNRRLVLVRHGQSEWNIKNLFTGLRNPPLTSVGITEAIDVGKKFVEQGIAFDAAFSSSLKRAQDTCQIILREINQQYITPIYDDSLNERDYGHLSGMNKDDVCKEWGKEQVRLWRRSYDIAPPGGESLRDTVARVIPYYVQSILPLILQGKSVLVAAHGNSLRSLIMVLEKITIENIPELTIGTGEAFVYHLDVDATIISKHIIQKMYCHDSFVKT